jgi:hypothetical protein
MCVSTCRDLREAGLRCVEKIVAWVLCRDPEAAEPVPFVWNDQVGLLRPLTSMKDA